MQNRTLCFGLLTGDVSEADSPDAEVIPCWPPALRPRCIIGAGASEMCTGNILTESPAVEVEGCGYGSASSLPFVMQHILQQTIMARQVQFHCMALPHVVTACSTNGLTKRDEIGFFSMHDKSFIKRGMETTEIESEL